MPVENSKEKKALKAGAWYTVSSIVVKAITILTTPIFTRMMTTGDYGMSSNFSSWYTLLMIFCSLNLTYSIGRAKLDFKDQLDDYVGSMQLLALFTTCIIGTIGIVFRKYLAPAMELNSNLMILLVVYLLFAPGISFTQSKFRYQYRYKENIGIAAFTTISSVVVTLLLMLVFKSERYYAKVLGVIITAVSLSSFFWIRAIKSNSVHINITYWKYGLAISLPLILHSLSLNVLSQSDRLMITKFCGTDANGIYSLAYSYAILINIIMHSVNEAWLPWFHDTYYAEEFSSIKNNVKPLVILGCMLGIGCIAIAPEAMLILGPKEYQLGQWAVAPVTVGIVCQFIYQQYVHIELHLKQTKYISAGTFIAAALNLILNLIFIPRFGFIAAAYTTLFCYFVLMFVHLFITRVLLKVHLYDDGFMFMALAVVACVAAFFMYMYRFIWIRYAILIIVCGLYCFLNRNLVKKVLARRKKK